MGSSKSRYEIAAHVIPNYFISDDGGIAKGLRPARISHKDCTPVIAFTNDTLPVSDSQPRRRTDVPLACCDVANYPHASHGTKTAASYIVPETRSRMSSASARLRRRIRGARRRPEPGRGPSRLRHQQRLLLRHRQREMRLRERQPQPPSVMGAASCPSSTRRAAQLPFTAIGARTAFTTSNSFCPSSGSSMRRSAASYEVPAPSSTSARRLPRFGAMHGRGGQVR